MTVEMCLSTCRDKEFRYSGIQWQIECYCGNEPVKGFEWAWLVNATIHVPEIQIKYVEVQTLCRFIRLPKFILMLYVFLISLHRAAFLMDSQK